MVLRPGYGGTVGGEELQRPHADVAGKDPDAHRRVAAHRNVGQRRFLRERQRVGRQMIVDQRHRGLVFDRLTRTRRFRRRRGDRQGAVRLPPGHVDPDAAAVRDARERVDGLRDAILVDVEVAGGQVRDQMAAPVADDGVDEHRRGRRGDDLTRRPGLLGTEGARPHNEHGGRAGAFHRVTPLF
jgi:hypothetical protein